MTASVLATAVVAWAWRHAQHVHQDRLEWVGGERLVEVTSDRQGVRFLLFRKWPWKGPGRIELVTLYKPQELEAMAYHSAAERPLLTAVGFVEVRSGRWQTFLQLEQPDGPPAEPEQDNPPVRMSYADPVAAEETLANGLRWSPALPFIEFRLFGHLPLLLAVATPVALRMAWLAVRGIVTLVRVERRWRRAGIAAPRPVEAEAATC